MTTRRRAGDEAVLGDHRGRRRGGARRRRPGTRRTVGYFRGGGYSSHFVSRGGMPVTMAGINLVTGIGPVLQIAEGWTVDLPQEVHDVLDERTDPTWPTHWFVPRTDGQRRRSATCTRVMANWARQPRRDQLRPHRRRPDQPGLDPAHPGPHAQRARGGRLPPVSAWIEPRHGRPRGRRLPGLRQLRAAVRAPLIVDAAARQRGRRRLRRGGRRALSRRFGRGPGVRPRAGGGNSSVKHDGTLYIKPSGVSLASMTADVADAARDGAAAGPGRGRRRGRCPAATR